MRASKNHIVYVFVHLLMIINNHMTSAQAITTYSVRLINTLSSVSNPTEGRLEIYGNAIWGTVCDDGFTNASARVACASLGYGYIGRFIGNRHDGGTGKIWLDDVTCTGSEYGIEQCPHRAWDSHDCSHGEDVSISCGTSEAFAIRLINSLSSVSNPMEGRLEIFYNRVWGTVCDDSFTNNSAKVACNNLGYGNIGTVITNRHGVGTGSIWLDEVTCRGTESSIDRCSHSAWGSHDCTHTEDVAISCGATPRLVNSLSSAIHPQEGRLEIYYAGKWGTVCDDSFTNISAGVACQSLGFGNIGYFVANRHGQGAGPIWLDNVLCNGTELGIDRCARNAWGTNDCSHAEDVSIRCGDIRDFAVRLINTFRNNSKEGRLEIYYSGIWGTVCDDSFTNVSAGVACASLGFGRIGAVIGSRHGGGIDAIWLDDVSCRGVETSIETCSHNGWGAHNCGHGEDVSISCGTIARLVNSSVNSKEGRLEIYYAGVWGTICDDGFNNVSARVACASLGFSNVGTFIGSRYGAGTGQIWLDQVTCTGTETKLEQCSAQPWGAHDCSHSEDVSISCDSNPTSRKKSRFSKSLFRMGEVIDNVVLCAVFNDLVLRMSMYTTHRVIFALGTTRLVNSTGNLKEGRLEIYHSGVWGTICDDSFNNVSARVACASLGFGHVGTFIGSRYGSGTGQIWLDGVTCTGTETELEQCSAQPWGAHDCSHSEDVSISCVSGAAHTTETTASTTSIASTRTSTQSTAAATLSTGTHTNMTRVSISSKASTGTRAKLTTASILSTTSTDAHTKSNTASTLSTATTGTHKNSTAASILSKESTGTHLKSTTASTLSTASTGTYATSSTASTLSTASTGTYATSSTASTLSTASTGTYETSSTAYTLSTTSTGTRTTSTVASTLSTGSSDAHTQSNRASTASIASTGMHTKSIAALTMSSSMPTRNCTPVTLPIMSTLFSSSSKASDGTTYEFTRSSKISTSTLTSKISTSTLTSNISTSTLTSKISTSTLTTLPSSVTTDTPKERSITSLLINSKSTKTISPSNSKLLTSSTKTSTATTDGATTSSPTTSKASLMSVMSAATSESSDIKSKSEAALFNDATSENPSASLSLSSSDLLRNSSYPSIDTEQARNSASVSPGHGAIRIIGIVGALMIGIIFIIIAVFLRRRFRNTACWPAGEDSPRDEDLIALYERSS